MSDELANVNDTSEVGAGAVAAFVVGGIVATATVVTVSGLTKLRARRAVRKEEKLRDEIRKELVKETTKKK